MVKDLCYDVVYNVIRFFDNLGILTLREVSRSFLEAGDCEIRYRLNHHKQHFGIVSKAYQFLIDSIRPMSHLQVILNETSNIKRFMIFQNTLMFCAKKLICSVRKIIGLLWFQFDKDSFENQEIYWLKLLAKLCRDYNVPWKTIKFEFRETLLAGKQEKSKIFSTFIHLAIKGDEAQQNTKKYEILSYEYILHFRKNNERLLSYSLKFSSPKEFDRVLGKMGYRASIHFLKFLKHRYLENAFFNGDSSVDEIWDFGRLGVILDLPSKIKLQQFDKIVVDELCKLSLFEINQLMNDQKVMSHFENLAPKEQKTYLKRFRIIGGIEKISTPGSKRTSLDYLMKAYEI